MTAAKPAGILRTIPLLTVMCLVTLPAQAQYGGGNGTADDPYQIWTAEQMNAIGAEPNDWDRHFKLMADIDLAAYTGTDFNIIAPFDGETAFTGVFDGDAHTIANFTYTSTDANSVALFGWVLGDARIMNLGLIDPRIEASTRDGVAPLVDYLEGGTVSGCFVRGGSVSGGRWVGGLVACNDGAIVNCYSSAAVTGGMHAGGLVGTNGGIIRNSYSTGHVAGDEEIGGLVSSQSYGTITGCYWDIETSGQSTSAGGVGKTTAELQNATTFLQWWADVAWTIDEGYDYPRLVWEGTPGVPICPPVPPACEQGAGQFEIALSYTGGTGEPGDPYLIYTPEQLHRLGSEPNDWGKHFRLMADIDLRCTGMTIGYRHGSDDNKPFTGVFDGNGHAILNLRLGTVTFADELGLFGRISDPNAMIKNLGLRSPVVYAINGDTVGSLVGNLDMGTVSGCYTESGVVHARHSVGGLMGNVEAAGRIVNCYNVGTFVAAYENQGAGGLVGRNRGQIATSYSTGSVSGLEGAEGLVGLYYDYGRVLHSAWDVDYSGSSRSAGGVGLSTAEMMNPYMLGINGFANDPNWVLDAGQDYPRLAWEGTPGQTIPEPTIDWLAGLGVAEDPYQIDTADQLILLGKSSLLWDRHFVLGADIDLGPSVTGREVFQQALIPGFSGVFDGSDHEISHLTIKGANSLGLFGVLESPGQVTNLGVVDVDVEGSDSVGGLSGTNFGRVIRCHTTGTVTGNSLVGGLTGSNGGTISASSSTSTVNGIGRYSGDIGGLVGTNGPAFYVDHSETGILTQCYSAGAVNAGQSDKVGGLVGCNWGSVSECYSTNSVDGYSDVGGLVGSNPGEVMHCYSAGSVRSVGAGGGGLVGTNIWGVQNVVLNRHGTTTDSFWDIQTSGQSTSAGGFGKTTAEMKTYETFLIWGTCGNIPTWTIDEGKDYPRLWWEQSDGELIVGEATLAELLAGDGSQDSPYLISTAGELDLIGAFPCDWDKHFRLIADIDLDPNLPGRKVFRQAVIESFTGVFDGNGHSIAHLTIAGGSSLGLFGHLGEGASVSNLGLEAVDVNGTGSYVGGLAGSNSGDVRNCYSTGRVSGGYGSVIAHSSHRVGGLVGDNQGTITASFSACAISGQDCVGGLVGENDRGSIAMSCSTGTVTGDGSVGGLVGRNDDASIINSYSTSAVSGGDYVGGLAGSNGGHGHGSIINSYSTGAVSGDRKVGGLVGSNTYGSTSASFWDMETSGLIKSDDGIGRTTAEMQTASTFLESGWDFVDETENGTDDIWWILEGQDYPRLWWEADEEASP